MSTHHVVTLTCDKAGCRERYIGGRGKALSAVRAEAGKLAGWRSDRAPSGTPPSPRDLCRWHS
jgi:hypothetical protein